MQQCADDVRTAFPGNKRALAPIDALIATARDFVRGEPSATPGIAELIVDLSTAGPPKPRGVVLALQALAAFAYALDELTRGDPTGVAEDELQRARELSAMSVVPLPVPPTVAELTARIEQLTPGDVHALAAVVVTLRDHRMRDLVPLVFERLELDDSTGLVSDAVRTMQRLFRPRVEKFTELCAQLLSSPRAATRRWAAYGLQGTVSPAHVPQLIALLTDAEVKVRKEAATALRAAATHFPESKGAIQQAAVAASARFSDPAIAELVRSTT